MVSAPAWPPRAAGWSCPAAAPRAAPASSRKPAVARGGAGLSTAGSTPAEGGSRLRPHVRIRQPAEFKQVFAEGFRVTRSPLAATCRPRQGEGGARLGLAIARKAAPRAVDRNRIKRLIREHFRQHQAGLPAVDLVFYGTPGLAQLDNIQLRQRVEQIWLKVIERCAA